MDGRNGEKCQLGNDELRIVNDEWRIKTPSDGGGMGVGF